MTTLAEYRQQMLTMDSPEDLGEVHAISSVDAQSLTVARKATGVVDSSLYEGRYLLRPDAANATDREPRIVTAFDASSGTFSHEGGAYTDVTATDELVEVHQHDPRLLDEAINYTLAKLYREDVTEVPGMWGGGRHWLTNLPWIEKPGDVTRITRTASPVLSRNRYFDKWTAYDASGVLTPDAWTVSSGTVTRDSGTQWRTKYTMKLVDGLVTQDVPAALTGVDGETLRGSTVTAVLVALTSVASNVRLSVESGGSAQYSNYHTGSATFEELTVEHTVDADSTAITLNINVDTATAGYIGEGYLLYGTLNDFVRRDAWPEAVVYSCFEQSASLPAILDSNFGRAYRVHSYRAYPEFPAAMVRAGTADTLVSDAPLIPVATGALYHLYSRLAQRKGEDTTRYAQIAAEWRQRWEKLARDHPYTPNKGGGMPLRPRMYAMPARRF